MANRINATTPQLEFMDRMFEAFCTRDANNIAPFLSRDFSYKSFPEISELSDQTKAEFVKTFGPLFAPLTKLEYTFHEVIESPGKVVVQWTALCIPPSGATFEYDSLSIYTLAEEDGELKLINFKDFSDPEKRSYFHKTMSMHAGGQIA